MCVIKSLECHEELKSANEFWAAKIWEIITKKVWIEYESIETEILEST